MKNIGVFTATRAEYGLLKSVIDRISKDKELNLKLVVTGMHLSPEFGLTYEEIIQDGYTIDDKIEILMSSDTPEGIVKTMGMGMISFADYFRNNKLDGVVILGDRYESISIASCATVFGVPIAHIHGGETTEGAIDEVFRHAITKMSYIHFTSNEIHRKRVIQLGEEPNRVFDVGGLGREAISSIKLLDKKELEESIGFELGEKYILVTYHPVTLENNKSEEYFRNILSSIDELIDFKVIFTKANSDTYGRIINNMIDDYVMKNKERCIAFTSMGQLRYLSAVKSCYAVLGNSSSGLLEAPYLSRPTVNIGDRQKGRYKEETVIDCGNEKLEILEAFRYIESLEYAQRVNKIKYSSSKKTSELIVKEIKNILQKKDVDLKKKFYDLK